MTVDTTWQNCKWDRISHFLRKPHRYAPTYSIINFSPNRDSVFFSFFFLWGLKKGLARYGDYHILFQILLRFSQVLKASSRGFGYLPQGDRSRLRHSHGIRKISNLYFRNMLPPQEKRFSEFLGYRSPHGETAENYHRVFLIFFGLLWAHSEARSQWHQWWQLTGPNSSFNLAGN